MNLHPKIEQRAFNLFLMDNRHIRTLYSRSRREVPRALLNRTSKTDIIHHILMDEFGEGAIVDYYQRCKEWDDFEKEFGGPAS